MISYFFLRLYAIFNQANTLIIFKTRALNLCFTPVVVNVFELKKRKSSSKLNCSQGMFVYFSGCHNMLVDCCLTFLS